MRHLPVAFGLLATSLLSSTVACAANAGAKGAESLAGRIALTAQKDDQACTGEQALPILAALLPIAVSQTLEFFEKMAADKAASYEATVSGSAADSFLINCESRDEPDMRPRLIGLHFGYGAVSGTADQKLDPSFAELGFTSTPKVYLEGKFEFAEGAHYARFIPTRLDYNDTLAKSGTEKDVLITMSFNFPSADSGSTLKRDSTSSNDAHSVDKTSDDQAKAKADAEKEKKKRDATKKEEQAAAKAKADAAKTDAGKADAAKTDAGKADAGKADAGKADAGKADAAVVGQKSPSDSAIVGNTQSVVLPVFERMARNRSISLNTVTSGWFALPNELPSLKIDQYKYALPVTVDVIVKETDAGHGSAFWLAVSNAIKGNSAAISSALLGKNQSTTSKSGSSTSSSQ